MVGHRAGQVLVAANLRSGKIGCHLVQPVLDRLGARSGLDQVAVKFLDHPMRPQRLPSSLAADGQPLKRRIRQVVEPAAFGIRDHLVQPCRATPTCTLLVSEDIRQAYPPMPPGLIKRDLPASRKRTRVGRETPTIEHFYNGHRPPTASTTPGTARHPP